MRRLGIVFVAACGVRAPTPIDTTAMVRAHGLVEARRDLEIRIIDDPRDVAARLAAAELDLRLHEPSDAIDQYESVERLGGPAGVRWHDVDRQRFATLLAARGTLRVARGANGIDDLRRAAKLGAAIAPAEIDRGRAAVAVMKLRHVDAKERAAGREIAASLVGLQPAWAGANANATPAQHASFGVWLWAHGAKREAYEQLKAWNDAAQKGAGDFAPAFRAAAEWWSPDAAFTAAQRASEPVIPAQLETAAPSSGDLRADAAATYVRARLIAIVDAGRGERVTVVDSGVIDGRGVHTATELGIPLASDLVAIARAFRRDPAVAERLARDLVARSTDSAFAHAAIGALFDALGDPARARTAWLAASTDSSESAIVEGYAAAAARAGDGDAALVSATGAAASSGDPAATWLVVARALMRGQRMLDAVTALRTALDLAGSNTLADVLALATDASRAVGRSDQADRFAAQRAQLQPPVVAHEAQRVEINELAQHAPNASVLAAAWVATRDDPHDLELRAALLASLDTMDPRRATLEAELVALAGDRDADRALAAVLSLK